ncbi:MAG: hypothetical protein ABI616_15235 [Pseudomonadota bacterium]
MQARFNVLATTLLLATLASAQNVHPYSAFVANWHEVKGPKSVGMSQSFEDAGDGRFRLILFPQRAPAAQTIVEGRCDGRAYPHVHGDGSPAASTFTCKLTGPRKMEYVFTQTGESNWKTSTGTQTVSADGKSLTLDAVHRDKDGKSVEILHYDFERRD